MDNYINIDFNIDKDIKLSSNDISKMVSFGFINFPKHSLKIIDGFLSNEPDNISILKLKGYIIQNILNKKENIHYDIQLLDVLKRLYILEPENNHVLINISKILSYRLNKNEESLIYLNKFINLNENNKEADELKKYISKNKEFNDLVNEIDNILFKKVPELDYRYAKMQNLDFADFEELKNINKETDQLRELYLEIRNKLFEINKDKAIEEIKKLVDRKKSLNAHRYKNIESNYVI